MIDINVEAFRQLAFLGSVLAGFSITIISFILSGKGSERSTNLAIKFYFVCSALFLFVTIILSFALIIASKAQMLGVDIYSHLQTIGSICIYVFFTGMLFFCIATGLIGRIHSSGMARFSTTLMIMMMISVFCFIIYLILLL